MFSRWRFLSSLVSLQCPTVALVEMQLHETRCTRKMSRAYHQSQRLRPVGGEQAGKMMRVRG